MTLKLDDLRHIMRECAGGDDSADADGDFADADFSDLGYDSLALMETASRIERKYGVAIPESGLSEIRTPNDFLRLVNSSLEPSS